MKTKLIMPEIRSNFGAELLKNRGISDIDLFCNPTEECLEDWRDLDHIKEGVDLIFVLPPTANIGIIVDCDTDGYTSAAIIGQYLKRYLPESNITYYIHEGKAHGLEEHFEEIQDSNYDLLIIPDAGSNDGDYIKDLDFPVLVIDHHLCEYKNFPLNMILINNQESAYYKNKFLSGAGMTYQFCRAMDYYFEKNWAKDYIDLAATGICGDMMDGRELENQYFFKIGFSNIKNKFLKALCEKQAFSMKNEVTPITVAFYIVPLINAMIRMGTLEEKTRMFIAFLDGDRLVPSGKRGEKGMMVPISVESARECTNARTHQNKQKDEVVMQMEQKIFKNDLLENQILFIRLDEDDIFPSELNGLIAMTLSAKYKRPTIVARLNKEGEIKGSARGVNNSELDSFKQFLDETNLMTFTAGHDQAFGIGIMNSQLSKLHEIANKKLLEYDFGEECYEVDFELPATSNLLKPLIFDLNKYHTVYSQNCGEPLIHVTDLNVTWDDMDIVGKNQDTLRITKNGVTFIKFFAKDLIENLKQHKNLKLEVVGKASINEWGGRTTPQILINALDFQKNLIIDF